MEKFIEKLKNKSIHIVGVTGAEGSNILRLLCKHKIKNITAHDFIAKNSIEKNFKLWHKNISVEDRNKLYQQFTDDRSKTSFYSGINYLKGVTSADIIFVPQSWRLYRKQNQLLWEAKKKNTPFYSLTRIYLDYAPAQIIAVTGTVGKGSVANILVQLLKSGGKRRIYFAGNETWMLQIADRLEEMDKNDILVLEISHRQLQDGWNKPPPVAVITNLYPNHLDELSWEEYKKLKLSLIQSQTAEDYSVLNYDIPELRRISKSLDSKVVYFSEENKEMNIKVIQNIFQEIMNTKIDQYNINILAAATAAIIMNTKIDQINKTIPKLKPLPARIAYICNIDGRNFYDDIKSTTPWATSAALNKLRADIILICGGRIKGINYQEFTYKIKSLVKHLIIIKSQLSEELTKYLPDSSYQTVDNLQEAIVLGYKKSKNGDYILISPAASFFYTDFIKGKKSLKKLITSLPPMEQVVEA